MTYSRRDLPLNALRAFEAVARARSFTLGADALNIAQSACSRHIARLEEIVGRRMFLRSGKAIRLTEAGEQLLPAVQRAFDVLVRALDQVSTDAILTLHVPPTFVQTMGLPFIQRFKEEHQGLGLTIMSTYSTGIPSGDYDIAIIFDHIGDHKDGRTLLWPISMTPLCSIDDAPRIKAIGLEEALRQEDLLHVQLEGYPQDHLWRRFAHANGINAFKPSSLAFETAALAIEFARAGAGLALADTRLADRNLAAQGLAAPFDVSLATGFAYYLIWSAPSRKRTGASELKGYIERLAVPGI